MDRRNAYGETDDDSEHERLTGRYRHTLRKQRCPTRTGQRPGPSNDDEWLSDFEMPAPPKKHRTCHRPPESDDTPSHPPRSSNGQAKKSHARPPKNCENCARMEEDFMQEYKDLYDEYDKRLKRTGLEFEKLHLQAQVMAREYDRAMKDLAKVTAQLRHYEQQRPSQKSVDEEFAEVEAETQKYKKMWELRHPA